MENGYYYTATRIKEDATPIHNVTKFAWYDDDYETVELWHEYTEEELLQIQEMEKQQEKNEQNDQFLSSAPSRLDDIELSQKELILVMADMIGGE